MQLAFNVQSIFLDMYILPNMLKLQPVHHS
jgi:hypothetical protein